ncbi:MAG: hypothetical protein HDR51_04925 [Treponema sp.]|nr:hypothetical protein [Treponema sp.]
MNFLFYPDTEEFAQNIPYEEAEGVVGKEIKKLKKQHKNIYLRVKSFLNKICEVNNLNEFYERETIRDLGGGLNEIRIPKQNKGGVFRIYFCKSKNNDNLLILLDAEFKHKKKGERIEIARKKQKTYMNNNK